jgi:VWFA-related protein
MNVTKYSRTLSFLALSTVLLAWPVFPQTIAIPGETIEVSIVNLDVVVTDKKGHRIYRLPQEAFEVFEDGKPQPITNFTEYRADLATSLAPPDIASSARSQAAPAPEVKRQPRVIVIFADQLKLPHFKVDPVFDGLEKLLRQTVEPGDAVMVVSWNLRLVTRVTFTDDLSTVHRAMDAIAKESIGVRFGGGIDMHLHQWEIAKFLREGAGVLGSDREALPFDAQSVADISRHEMQEKMTAIKAVLTSIAAFDGRKLLVLISDGLGGGVGGDLIATANAAGVTVYGIYPQGMAMTFASDASVSGRQAMGSSPGAAAMMDWAVLRSEMSPLEALAAQTGGLAGAGAIDISRMLPRIREDLGSYYSLAYRVPSNRNGQSHSVSVKAKNAAYRVRSRHQFVEKSDDALMRDRVLANLLREPAGSVIPVSISAGHSVKVKKHLYSVPIVVKIGKGSLTMLPVSGTNRGAFTVYLAPGRVVGYGPGVWTQKVPFTAQSEARDGYFTYEFDLVTDLATDRLSVGVIDDLSHDTGFARIELPTASAN